MPAIRSLLAPLLLTLFLSACGGGGDGDSTSSSSSDILSGQFVDSAVQGLGYTTLSQSGYTDADGRFSYKAGEIIEFRIGELLLGYAQAKAVITPMDLVGALSADDPTAVNIAQLLQTFDIDGDPSNGIALPPSADLDAGTNLGDDAAIITALSNFDANLTTLVPDADAQSHLEQTLASLPPPPAFSSDYSFLLTTTNPDSLTACSAGLSGMTVNRNADGSADIYALITVNGSVETLAVSKPYNQYLTFYTSPGSIPVRVDLNEKKAIVHWGDSSDAGGCWGSALLSAADGVNDAPFTVDKGGAYQLCRYDYTQGAYYDPFGLVFAARDDDGYINGPGTLKVTGAESVTIPNGTDPQTYSTYYPVNGEIVVTGSFDYALEDPFGKKVVFNDYYNPVGDDYSINKTCDQAVSWEYTVTDNEGASRTIQGQVPASDIPAPGSDYGTISFNGGTFTVYDAQSLGSSLRAYIQSGAYDLKLWVDPLPASGETLDLVASRYDVTTTISLIDDINAPGDAFYAYIRNGSVSVADVNGDRIITISAVLDIASLDGIYYEEGLLSYPFSATIINPHP